LDQRGKHTFAMLREETLTEAGAAARAGVLLLSVPPAMVFDRRFRKVAPMHSSFPATISMKSARRMISCTAPFPCSNRAQMRLLLGVDRHHPGHDRSC